VRGDYEWPLLGMEFLSRFKTTLDFAHDQMLLEPTSDYQKRVRIKGDVGLEMAQENGKLNVSFVDLQSTAFKDGLRPRDRIEAIDGIDVSTMDVVSAGKLLPQHIGDSVHLRVRHENNKDNKPFEVTLTAVDPFSPVQQKLAYGFGLGSDQLNEKSILKVTSVAPDSGAADSGLRTGDQFLSIKNKPATGRDIAEIVAYLKDPVGTGPLPVTVHRDGVKEPVTLTIVPKIQSPLDALPWPEEKAEQSPVKPILIPFQYDPAKKPSLLAIQARINGSAPLLFLVNTNLRSNIVLFSWALKTTGLKLLPAKDQPEGTGPGDSFPKITGPCQLRPEIAIGSVDATMNFDYTLVVDEVDAVRNYPEGHVAGIVGASFLTYTNTVLDFDSKTINWLSVLPLAVSDVSTVVLPLKSVLSNKDGLYIDVLVKSASDKNSKGTPVTFLLDTGSTNSALPGKLAGSGADTKTGSVSRSLSFGNREINDVPLNIGADTSEPTLGLDVLSRFRITIDKARGQIRLMPRSELKE
jgi:hypothetical protein